MTIQDGPQLSLVFTSPLLKASHLMLFELRIIPQMLLVISERINAEVLGI